MKKYILLLLAFLPFGNALAVININCSVSTNNVTISYNGVSSDNLIRGFAIDILPDPNSGADVTVDMDSLNPMYSFYPGSVIFDSNGYITDEGTPIADSNAPGVSQGGITIEMVSEFINSDTTKPATSGNLLTFSVDKACTIQLSANKFRGGIVLEDGITAADINFSSCTVDITKFTDGFETSFDKWTDGVTTDWDRTTGYKYSGSYSAHAGSSDNDLISDNIDTSGYYSMTITFWYIDDDIDDDDNIYLQLYDGSAYDNKFELGNTSPEDTWHKYEVTIYNTGSDTQYFISNFRLKFEGTSIDSGENLWIDDVLVTALY